MTLPDLMLNMILITASITVLFYLMPVIAGLLEMINDLIVFLIKVPGYIYRRIVEGKYDPIKELEKALYELEEKRVELILLNSELRQVGANLRDKEIRRIEKVMNTEIKSMKEDINMLR